MVAQNSHPDLAANARTDLDFDFLGQDANPSPIDPTDSHGTAVASIIAGVGNNGIGTTGIAYNADFVSMRYIPGDFDLDGFNQTDLTQAQAFGYRNDVIDIKNHSYGSGGRIAIRQSPIVIAALRDSILFGRDRLGVIHVKSSGNSGGPGFFPEFGSIPGQFDSATYDQLASSRYMITVGGLDENGSYYNPETGSVTSYPEAGPSVLIVAPTGSNPLIIGDDNSAGSGIWTADRTGDNGSNASPLLGGFEFDRDFFADINYTSRFNGTSASAPMVSGVVALMLEANPSLTYRDVQHILLRSARQTDQFDASWVTNPYTFYVLPIYNLASPDQGDQAGDLTNPITGVPIDEPLPGFGFDPDGFNIMLRQEFYADRLDSGEAYDQQLMFENGAGYTVSQAYGEYGELYGYAHGAHRRRLGG